MVASFELDEGAMSEFSVRELSDDGIGPLDLQDRHQAVLAHDELTIFYTFGGKELHPVIHGVLEG